MPFFDDSPPPNKKRKTITTYGSQGIFGRAMRLVKDAVPTSLIPSHPRQPDSHSIHAEEASHHTKPSASPRGAGSPSSPTLDNGVSSNGSEKSADGTEHHSYSQEVRTSKRLRRHPASSVETPARKKRRKAGTKGEPDGREPPQASVEKVNGPTADSSKGIEDSLQDVEGTNDAGQDDVEATGDYGTSGEKIDHHTPKERSRGKPRRAPHRFSARHAIEPPAASPFKNTKTPQTSTSTPGKKRGRPRKHPVPMPTSPDMEENEMGFRKITSNQHHVAPKLVETPGNIQPRSYPQQLSKEDAKSWTTQRSDEHAESQESADEIASNGGTPQLPKTKSSAHPSGVQSQQPDVDFNVLPDAQKPNKTHTTLLKSTIQLQRLLDTCPKGSFNLFMSELLKNQRSQHSATVNMDDEYHKLHQLVTQTVLAGEGNSMLVIGPRGCGKTTLVESVLSDLARDHQEDFLVIRLSGFIHTDDKLALREIWRQLGREVAADDETTGSRTNYADTLTSLLALLAHSFEDEAEITRSVVFVIDEFDLFASHPRQTLLYNLFDVAQSRNAPIAVLGLTTRIDVVESLEKRVKSRFGQRYIHLSYPKNFASFHAMCKSALISREPADQTFHDRLGNDKALVQQLRVTWKEYVDALFAHDLHLNKFLRHLFAQSNCVASFKSASYLPLAGLSSSNIPTGTSWMSSSLLPPDSKLQLIPSLSDLELSLVIAAARLDIILDTNMCSFAMVYDEYVQLASRVKLQTSAAGQTAVGGGTRVWAKDVARGAWEKLMELELLLNAGTGTRSGGQMCRVDVTLEEIGRSVPKMGSTMARWCKEI
ncbi:MAG: hypothetical protein L6R40_003148 [Gallowayella cf. fulva]|nr:MAG: hypothetical protein L6R40_003148 [Xanthomendoza cf. fulva]